MSQPDDFTPTDRPIMLSDLNAIKKAVHRSEQATVSMYTEFRGMRDRLWYSLGFALFCAVASFACAAVALAAASPAP